MDHLQEIVENHNIAQLTVAGLWLELHPRSSRIQSRRVQAMAQADSCWPLSAETQVQSQASPCGICGEQSGIGPGFGFFWVLLFSHVSILQPMLYTYSSVTKLHNLTS